MHIRLECEVFQLCLAGNEHPEEVGITFKAEVTVASFPALLFHTVSAFRESCSSDSCCAVLICEL